MSNRVIHIGFPKTATTFLQWEVFPQLEGINYIDYNACRRLFPYLISLDKLDYELEPVRSAMVQYEKAEATNLYSFESLCGSPYAYKGMNRSSIAHGLRDLGFNKVIITVRDQAKAIDSFYRQYIVHGGTLRFKDWLDIENKRNWMHKHFSLSYLKYDLLAEHYYQLFGAENVLVLDSSSFKSDESIAKLVQFIGAERVVQKEVDSKRINASLTNLSTNLLRICNYFTYNTIRPSQFFTNHISTRNAWLLFKVVLDPYFFRFLSSSKSYLTKYDLKNQVDDYFFESNKKLADLTSIKF